LPRILVSIILNTATGSRSIGHNAALAVGSAVALLGLFASPISGASMNPAHSLGPDIVSTDYTGWWVYVAGPVIGAYRRRDHRSRARAAPQGGARGSRGRRLAQPRQPIRQSPVRSQLPAASCRPGR
jgi:Major intrinsic protein